MPKPVRGVRPTVRDLVRRDGAVKKAVKHKKAKREAPQRTPARLQAPVLPEWDKERDIYPLSAPGLSLPGPDFIDMARILGDATSAVEGKGKNASLITADPILTDLYKRALYSTGNFSCRTTLKSDRKVTLRVVAGHRWAGEVTGPVRSPVMILGKMLGEEEVTRRRNLIGKSGQLLYDVSLELATESQMAGWYVTNLLKTGHPQGPGNSTLRQSWIKEWQPILEQELRLVRPNIILCLGADASKALLGKLASVTWMEGRIVEHTFPVSRSSRGALEYHTALVMTVIHPAAVLKAPELEDKFRNGMARFVQLASGQRWDLEEEGLDHRHVTTLEELRELADEVDADCEDNLIGIDAEWHGQHPQNKGAYLRSFQISWRHKTAAYISLRGEGGAKIYDKSEMKEVREFIKRMCRGKQLAAHFGDADMEFLTAFGIDLREQYQVPDTWQRYMRDCLNNKPCGFDTGGAAHALNETDDFSLTSQALRHTTAPRYDAKLVDWKKSYCKEHGLKNEELEGYGECPDKVLVPYGNYDADVARRLAVKRKQQLGRDYCGNNCWEPFWMYMRALPVVLEINTTGAMIDRDRVDELTETYMSSKAELEQRVRDWAGWPEFNLNSVFQVREFLFGEELNGKDRELGAPPIRIRPPKAKSLKLEPNLTTDKRPVAWEKVVQEGLQNEKTPSTNKTSLSVLAQDNQEVWRYQRRVDREVCFDFSKQVNWIRDYRFISQVLKSCLRPPIVDEEEDGTEVYRVDDDGYYVYAGGIPSAICSDGRVRTHIYPTKETRRWSSARPPMQNFAKRREADYKRILGDRYNYTLRSMVTASPGKVLVEADYIGAELFGMALMAGDPGMIEHAQRNQLPEDHPNFYDVHSNVAAMAFRLDCEPTKAGLYSIDMVHLRIVAKAVIFGIAYGRGAKAIALAAKEEKVEITIEEAQRVIDTIFAMYPKLVPFFTECSERALNERWLCNCFGSFRRFPIAREFSTRGDFERQAKNFPIQSLVADAVARACDALHTYRCRRSFSDGFYFDIILQIHDAILFEVENKHVGRLIDKVIPYCLVDSVPIYPTRLNGMPKPGANEYYLGVDTEVSDHWGELMYPDEFQAREIDPKYGGWTKVPQGWRHIHKNTDCAWKNGRWCKLAA